MTLSLRARRWLRLLPLALIAGLLVGLIASGALQRLSLGALSQHQGELLGFAARHPLASLGAFLGVYLLVVIACAPGPAILTLAGGLLFGPIAGGAAALAAMVAGGTAVFLACRTAFGDWASRRAGATIARIEAGFSRDAFSYLLALRLMPAAPFFAVNLAAGLARVRLSSFVLATLIGSAPSAFIIAALGSGLGAALRRHEVLQPSLFARPAVLWPLFALAALALAPIFWRFWRTRRR